MFFLKIIFICKYISSMIWIVPTHFLKIFPTGTSGTLLKNFYTFKNVFLRVFFYELFL